MTERNLAQRQRYLTPRASVSQTPDGRLRVTMEMPGVQKNGLDIRIESNELRVTGRRPAATDKKYILRERPQGDFFQTYTLDETVDQSKIDASLARGVLSITLDLKEHVKPRTITVRAQ